MKYEPKEWRLFFNGETGQCGVYKFEIIKTQFANVMSRAKWIPSPGVTEETDYFSGSYELSHDDFKSVDKCHDGWAEEALDKMWKELNPRA